MYYRRRVLLGLLEALGGKAEKLKFQKALFLLSRMQHQPSYDFVPYKNGPFSFQSYSDIGALGKYNLICEDDKYLFIQGDTSFIGTLTEADQNSLSLISCKLRAMSTTDVLRHVYNEYPWYATKSDIVGNLKLTENDLGKIKNELPKDIGPFLFTIGYEGRSLDTYINILLRNNVKSLIDVRRNPISMKYGFSKRTLSSTCQKLGIDYSHMYELGIESSKRKSLVTQTDYDSLFLNYEVELNSKLDALKILQRIILEQKRVALTCFEASSRQCHRGQLANYLLYKLNVSISLKHL